MARLRRAGAVVASGQFWCCGGTEFKGPELRLGGKMEKLLPKSRTRENSKKKKKAQ